MNNIFNEQELEFINDEKIPKIYRQISQMLFIEITQNHKTISNDKYDFSNITNKAIFMIDIEIGKIDNEYYIDYLKRLKEYTLSLMIIESLNGNNI